MLLSGFLFVCILVQKEIQCRNWPPLCLGLFACVFYYQSGSKERCFIYSSFPGLCFCQMKSKPRVILESPNIPHYHRTCIEHVTLNSGLTQ